MAGKLTFTAALLALLGAGAALAVPSPIIGIPNLNAALEDGTTDGVPFAATGTVRFCNFPRRSHASIDLIDSSGMVRRFYGLTCRARCRLGDQIELRGEIGYNCDRKRAPVYSSIRILAPHGAFRRISGGHFFDDENLGQHISLRGVVRECYRDENVPDWIYLILFCEGNCLNATLFSEGDDSIRATILGKRVELAGWVAKASLTPRKSAGRVLVVADPSYLRILDPPSTGAFDAPALETRDPTTRPEELLSLGLRRLGGTVLAVWDDDKVLLRTPDGQLVDLFLESPEPPAWGARIVAVGLPTTNFYNLQLEHARWQADGSVPVRADSAPDDPRASSGARTHGQRLRIVGIVRYISDDGFHGHAASVEVDGELVTVDLTRARDIFGTLSVGSRIAATGICILEHTPLSPTHPIPTVRGVRLAVRQAGDIEILNRPSRWTSARVGMVAGALLLVLLGVTVWNVALRKVAVRKGRALAREQISRAEAELRIGERTRLAIELHDTLSQNLMGVAMRLDAVARAISPCGEPLRRKIDLLANAIKYCREELRQCLWDLRSTALELPDMNEALRQTLAPHVGAETSVSIRFNVPRSRLTDPTVHALIRIIRELTLNALHHGGATRIRIAGTLEGDTLHFFVADNGCGFDIQTAPGIREGHFGLQGIRERVNLLGGSVTVASRIGRGTKVTIHIRAARNRETA